MNRKSWQEIQKDEKNAKSSHGKAEEAFNKTWDDPDLQDQSKQLAREHNSEIDQAKEQLEELTPGYEKAQEFLDLEKGLEAGQEKEHSMSHGMCKGLDL